MGVESNLSQERGAIFSSPNSQQPEIKRTQGKRKEGKSKKKRTTQTGGDGVGNEGERTPRIYVTDMFEAPMEEGRLLKQPDVEVKGSRPPHFRNEDDGHSRTTGRSTRNVHRHNSSPGALGWLEKDASESKLKRGGLELTTSTQVTNNEAASSFPPPQERRLDGFAAGQPGAFAMRSGRDQQRRTRGSTDVSVLTRQNYDIDSRGPSAIAPETPIVATVVENGSNPTHPANENDSASKPPPFRVLLRDRRICILVLLLVILLLMVVGLAGGVVYLIMTRTNGDADAAPALAPTLAPTLGPTRVHQEIYEILVARSHDNGQSLANETLPQFWSAQQLLSDPQVTSYSVNRILQRYAMGVLYSIFFTSNDDVWTSVNFTDECSWEGLVCNGFGEVVEIEMRWTYSRGYLPHELSLLSTLCKNDWL